MTARLFRLVLLIAGSASAADLQPGDVPVPPEEWRSLTEGRTVWYSLDGRPWGREYFHPDGATATFMTPDGQCLTAPWGWSGGLYCFAYDGLDCFRHVRRGERLMVLPIEGEEAQVVEKIVDAPLFCGPSLSS